MSFGCLSRNDLRMPPAQIMTIPEAVDALGIRGRYKAPEKWLRRAIRAREVSLHMHVLMPSGTGSRTTYRVNLATVRAIMPEFVDAPERAASVLREPIREMNGHLRALREDLDEMRSQIAVLTTAVKALQPAKPALRLAA